MSKYKIMTPGPVQVPENVRLARSLLQRMQIWIRNSMMNTRKPVS